MHLLAIDFQPFHQFVGTYVLGLHWNSFGVRWYALAYVAGILLGWWYAIRLARKEALWGPRAPVMSRDQIDDLILWITVGVIVGGRVGSMVFYNTSALWQRPLEIFKIWEGGMSFHGGLIGVMAAMLIFARVHRIPVWGVDAEQKPVIKLSDRKMSVLRVSDLVAPCVPIGLFFGRIANFINGELWGRHTELPWGFIVPEELLPSYDQYPELPHHPTQLYEATLEGLVLFVILRMATHRGGQLRRPGAVTGIFLAGYGLFRILVEFVRAPDQGLDHLPLGLTMGMILSLPMLVAGVYLFMKARDEAFVVAAPQPEPAPKPKPKAAPKGKAAPKAALKAKPKAK